MRVIAGSARGRRLATFSGSSVRPTPDRVREALFSMLQSRLGSFSELRVLDLFAGTGALAIEALSRGAASATLVEQAPSATKTIHDNLSLCRVDERAELLTKDAWKVLPMLDASNPFDLIFIDPPYHEGLAERALVEIAKLGLLAPDGILCVETATGEDLSETAGSLQRCDHRRYGTVMISLYSNL